MIKTLIGLILLLLPFLLIYRFKDKKVGFAYVLSFLIAFHLIVAVFTQFFHIFNYGVIFGINLIVVIGVLIKIDYKELKQEVKKIKISKIDWILIFVLIILFIQLYFVHYNYTGKVTTINESYKSVKNMHYPYPYFSDEWSAITFIKYSISSGKLPLTNPYWYNSFFPNLELPFHSFLSEIILLLNLNPLTHYVILSLFSGLLICLLVYFILRINKVEKLAASIACLSVPYIVNGANLPGIWNLIPIIMGIIYLLLSLFFITIKDKKMVLFTSFFALVFYPPLFLLSAASILAYFIFDTARKEKIKFIPLYFLVIMAAAVFVAVFTYLYMNLSLKNFVFSYIKGKIFYPNLTPGSIPDFSIWKVIPIPVLLLSVFGIFKVVKRKIWLVALVFVGLLYWLLYSFVARRFIIDYDRVVVTTSILIVILSGFGLNCLIEYLRKFDFLRKYKILTLLQVLILIIFFFFIFSYTQRDNWKELKLRSTTGEGYINPAAPASAYLHEDDLKLFQNIEKKRFLTLPWKGTVIGTSTSNYPLTTKPATLTNHRIYYNDFMKSNCAGKIKIAEKYKINYVYSKEFECEGFELRGISKEKIYLYEVVKG